MGIQVHLVPGWFPMRKQLRLRLDTDSMFETRTAYCSGLLRHLGILSQMWKVLEHYALVDIMVPRQKIRWGNPAILILSALLPVLILGADYYETVSISHHIPFNTFFHSVPLIHSCLNITIFPGSAPHLADSQSSCAFFGTVGTRHSRSYSAILLIL